MPMNKVKKGNMYQFITHTWNPIRGRCLHDCSYCYMKRVQGAWDIDAQLIEKELELNLGKDKAIFVGSSTDMWGSWIDREDILKVLKHCKEYDNQYLFQTKDPARYTWYDKSDFPEKTILCCTIETNRYDPSFWDGYLPDQFKRASSMMVLSRKGFDVAITIEPIMNFDLDIMVQWIKDIKPQWVAIGADSGKNNLDEPSESKVNDLIDALKPLTKIILKDNLTRII